MDAATLAKAMGCPRSKADQMVDAYNNAMRAANITTVNRAAMFAAQIGHESAGLVYMEELASGAAYEGRRDLGNTQPGDGRRFKGSGPIQLTGRANFTKFSKWAASKGHTKDPNLFVNKPHLVRTNPVYGFLAASWYWTVARPALNRLSDAKDLNGATRAINGGLNGLADRRARWYRCLKLGRALLPSKGSGSPSVPNVKMYRKDDVKRLQRAVGVHDDGAWGPATERNAQAIRHFLKGGLTPTDAQRKIYMEVKATRPKGKRTTKEFRKGIQWALGVTVDGIWGATTEAHWQALRSQHKMKSVKDTPDNVTPKKKKAPAKKPAKKINPRLAVDGKFGVGTITARERFLGGTADGKFGPASKRALQKWVGVRQDGIVGRNTVRAFQRKVGASVDGKWGAGTTRALQRFLNKQ